MSTRALKLSIVFAVFTFFNIGSFNNCKAISLGVEEAKFIVLINEYRGENKLTELKPTKAVQEAAEFMAEDFANHPDDPNLAIHIDSQGRRPVERSQAFGFNFLSENIAWGHETAQAVFNAWKNSPGHRDNMLKEGGRTIGITRYHKPGQTKKDSEGVSQPTEWFWVMDMSDEGVERSIGNALKSNEFISSDDFKKIKINVKKKKLLSKKYKNAYLAMVKVFDKSSGRLIDWDLTDLKGNATLYTSLDPGKVEIKVYKLKSFLKAKKTKIIKNWNKDFKVKMKI